MREMHKWKDKVELTLDNRQIFFLFFGVSVVGCFVFALGVMVGRRVDFDAENPAVSEASDSLALLGVVGEEESVQALTFQEGLATPATLGLPPTRDPSLEIAPPANEPEVPAPVAIPVIVEAVPDQSPPPPTKVEKVEKVERAAPGSAKPRVAPAKPISSAKPAATLAGSSPIAVAQSPIARTFTLQLKAFADREDAEALAATLRTKGHAVRVDVSEVKGRLWHRVRVGHFTSWDDGLEAKNAFEKRESLIAYVVRE